MINKKAQSQIITTVLIILLVLAAIVIVWQVVNSTIAGGAEEIEKQSACLGITMEASAVTGVGDQVTIKRGAGGGVLTGTGVVYIINGDSATYPGTKSFGSPFESEVINITTANYGGDVVVALNLSDGTVCSISGTATAGTA